MTTVTATETATRAPSVGTARTRVEGVEKVTGAARYAGEIPFTDLAHGWLALSTVARGRISALDTDAVLAMPGVLAVLDHRNALRLNTDFPSLLGMRPDPTCAVFQHDQVPHRGWPVALVVAETSEQARKPPSRSWCTTNRSRTPPTSPRRPPTPTRWTASCPR